ncbi:MAG: TIGR01777 family oxidoreductase [Candidatus Sumerlaeota bacterium]
MDTVAITGSSGLIGSALKKALHKEQIPTLSLVRDAERVDPHSTLWKPLEKEIDTAALEGLEAVVHLAGENIAKGRWTEKKKKRIHRSRVPATHFLATMLAGLDRKPDVFITASAVGYYGDTGDKRIDESQPPGETFLARVCDEWEAATRPAVDAGIRTVHLRLGMVLSPEGGALKAMLPIFRLGLGGPVGGGRQWVSWVALADATRAIRHIIRTPSISGPVNIASPEPVRQKDFAKALGRTLHRPTILPAPAFAVRLMLGEMADELLLSSVRLLPSRLQNHHFAFRFQTLENYLQSVLG